MDMRFPEKRFKFNKMQIFLALVVLLFFFSILISFSKTSTSSDDTALASKRSSSSSSVSSYRSQGSSIDEIQLEGDESMDSRRKQTPQKKKRTTKKKVKKPVDASASDANAPAPSAKGQLPQKESTKPKPSAGSSSSSSITSSKNNKKDNNDMYALLGPTDSTDQWFLSETEYWTHHTEFKQSVDTWLETIQRPATREQSPKAPSGGYILLHPTGQMGNRVIALASCIILGMLTDRAVFTVFEEGYYANLIDLFDMPAEFELRRLPGAAQSLVQSGSNMAINLVDNGFFTGSGFAQVNEFHCTDMSESLKSHRLLEITSGQYFVQLFFYNEHYKPWFTKNFPDQDVAGPLWRAFFKPSKTVQDWKKEYIAQEFDGKFVVGFQQRNRGNANEKHLGVPVESIRKTGEWMQEVIEKEYLNAPDDKQFRHIDGLRPRSKRSLDDVVIFVAADVPWSRDNVKEAWSTWNPKLLFYKEFLLSNNPHGCQRALLDVALMAESDELLTTPSSTFGYMMWAYHMKRAYMPTGVHDESKMPPIEEERTPYYMGEEPWSQIITGLVELPTYQPCYHKLAEWGLKHAKCFKPEVLQVEMRNGRYC